MTSQPKKTNKRYRTLRVEELESRDFLSVSPFGNDDLDVPENDPCTSVVVCPSRPART